MSGDVSDTCRGENYTGRVSQPDEAGCVRTEIQRTSELLPRHASFSSHFRMNLSSGRSRSHSACSPANRRLEDSMEETHCVRSDRCIGPADAQSELESIQVRRYCVCGKAWAFAQFSASLLRLLTYTVAKKVAEQVVVRVRPSSSPLTDCVHATSEKNVLIAPPTCTHRSGCFTSFQAV